MPHKISGLETFEEFMVRKKRELIEQQSPPGDLFRESTGYYCIECKTMLCWLPKPSPHLVHQKLGLCSLNGRRYKIPTVMLEAYEPRGEKE